MCDGDRDRVAVCLELNIAAVVFKDGVEFWSVPRSLSDTFQCIGTLFLGMYSIYPREVFACTDPSELIVAHRRKMLAVCPVSMKQIGEFDVGYADTATDDVHYGSMCTGMVGGCALLGVCVHTNNEALGVKLFEHCGPGAWTCLRLVAAFVPVWNLDTGYFESALAMQSSGLECTGYIWTIQESMSAGGSYQWNLCKCSWFGEVLFTVVLDLAWRLWLRPEMTMAGDLCYVYVPWEIVCVCVATGMQTTVFRTERDDVCVAGLSAYPGGGLVAMMLKFGARWRNEVTLQVLVTPDQNRVLRMSNERCAWLVAVARACMCAPHTRKAVQVKIPM